MCNTFTSFYSQSIFGLNPESGDLKFHAVGTRSSIQKRPHVQFLVGRGGSKVAIICKGEAELRCVLCANGSWKAEPVRLVMRGPRSLSLAKGPYYVSSLSHTHTYTRLHQQFTFVPAWIKREDARSASTFPRGFAHVRVCGSNRAAETSLLLGSRNRRRRTGRSSRFFAILVLFLLLFLQRPWSFLVFGSTKERWWKRGGTEQRQQAPLCWISPRVRSLSF